MENSSVVSKGPSVRDSQAALHSAAPPPPAGALGPACLCPVHPKDTSQINANAAL